MTEWRVYTDAKRGRWVKLPNGKRQWQGPEPTQPCERCGEHPRYVLGGGKACRC